VPVDSPCNFDDLETGRPLICLLSKSKMWRSLGLLALCLSGARSVGSIHAHRHVPYRQTRQLWQRRKIASRPRFCMVVAWCNPRPAVEPGMSSCQRPPNLRCRRSSRYRQLLRAFEDSSFGESQISSERGPDLGGQDGQTPDASPLEQALSLKASGSMSPLERALFDPEPAAGSGESKSPSQPHGTFLGASFATLIFPHLSGPIANPPTVSVAYRSTSADSSLPSSAPCACRKRLVAGKLHRSGCGGGGALRQGWLARGARTHSTAR